MARHYSILKELMVLHSCQDKKQVEPFACLETQHIK